MIEEGGVYRIKIKGIPPDAWLDRLGGLQITEHTPEGAILEGRLLDQAELAGVLDTLFALRLSVLEVTCRQD